MKKFLKSKKALIAAALAALLAMSGVTYAWFTWSVGTTGGSIKMDYVSIDATYGAYLDATKLGDLFTHYASGGNLSSYYPVRDGNVQRLVTENSLPEMFIPFWFFNAKRTAPDGTTVTDYLQNAKFDDAAIVADTNLAGLTYFDYLDYNGELTAFLASAANPNVDIAVALNMAFQHMLPSDDVSIGFQIKNYGAACFVGFADLQDKIKVYDSLKNYPYYITNPALNNNVAPLTVAWGINKWGNWIPNDGGWANDVPLGYTGGNNMNALLQQAKIDEPTSGIQAMLSPWTSTELTAGIPLNAVNIAYGEQASKIYIEDAPNSGVAKFPDVYPPSVKNPYFYDATDLEWEISVLPPGTAPVFGGTAIDVTTDAGVIALYDALDGGATSIDVIDATWLNQLDAAGAVVNSPIANELLSRVGVEFASPGMMAKMTAAIGLGNIAGNEYRYALAQLFVKGMIDDINFGTITTVAGNASPVVPYEEACLYVKNKEALLYIAGSDYTYKDDTAAPIINVKFQVHYGKYLNNAFVQSVLDFEDGAVVAVQDTDAAVSQVLLADGVFDRGLTDGFKVVSLYQTDIVKP